MLHKKSISASLVVILCGLAVLCCLVSPVNAASPTLLSFERLFPSAESTNATTLVFRATFDEDVQNVDPTDFAVTGPTGTTINVTLITDATYNITVSGGDLASFNGAVGLNLLDLAEGQNITDIAGNGLPNGEPAIDQTYLLDTTAPTVAILDAPTSVSSIASFTVKFKFSEDVTGFDVGDIDVGNGAAFNLIPAGINIYDANITPDGNGDITIDVAANVVQDGTGNDNTAATQVSVTFDATAPTVAIQNVPASIASTATFNVTFEFSEDVTGFDVGDIAVGNGAASNFVSVDGNTYTADITPDGNGNITIDVAANVAQDLAGNDNTAATQASVTFDATAPTVAIQNAPASVTSTAAFNVTFEFSEDVTGFDVGDIAVGNGAASNFVSVDGNTYTADITPDGNGNITIDVAANVAQDLAGNDNTAATQASVTFDATAPSVTIAAPTEARGAFTVTFTFSEAVNSFVVGDITVGNGAASNFSGSGASYSATIAPSSTDSTSAITIDVAAGVAQDTVGNLNTAAPQVSVSFINDTAVRERTTRVVKNFVSRRANQITSNEFDFTGRLGGASTPGGGAPATFTGEGDVHNNRMAFATSLRQILKSGEQAKAERAREFGKAMSLGTTSASGAAPQTGFDIWTHANWARFDNGGNEGDFGQLYVGADYRFESGWVAGIVASFDWTDEENDADGFTAEGKGWLLGPYIAGRIHDNLIFDGRLAYGKSDNEVSPLGTYTDSFDGTRWLAAGKFTGDFKISNFTFAPHVGVIYFEEKQESYVDSLSVSVPSQTVKLGRLTFGPKVSANFTTKDGTTIAPYLGVKGIWDFKTAEQVDIATGFAAEADGSDNFRARIDSGLSIQFSNAIRLTGEAFYDGIGAEDYESYGGNVTLSIPLQSDRDDATMRLSLSDADETQKPDSASLVSNKPIVVEDGNLGDHAGRSRTELFSRSGDG